MTEIAADLSCVERGGTIFRSFHHELCQDLCGFVWNARFMIYVCLSCLLCGNEVEERRILGLRCECLLSFFVLSTCGAFVDLAVQRRVHVRTCHSVLQKGCAVLRNACSMEMRGVRFVQVHSLLLSMSNCALEGQWFRYDGS